MADYWGDGNFLALKLTASDWEDYTQVRVGLEPSMGSGLVDILSDNDKNMAMKITNTTQKFVLEYGNGSTVKTIKYDLTDLVLESE